MSTHTNAAFSIVSLLCLSGCAVAPSGEVSRDDLSAGGKADATLAERFCVQHGAPAWCDPCHEDVGGFYGDGPCDLFCNRTDPDCEVDGSTCQPMSDAFLACTGRVSEPESCLHEEVDYELRSCCREEWKYSFCSVVSPVSREDVGLIPVYAHRIAQIAGAPAGESGQHQYFTYRAEAFDAAATMAEIRAIDADVRGCDSRTYSRSASSGALLYEAFLDEEDPFAGVEIRYYRDQFRTELRDPENTAVFASVPNDSDPACQYRDFYVLGPNQQGFHLYFDDRPARDGQLGGPSMFVYVGSDIAAIAGAQDEYAGNGSGAGVLSIHGEVDYEAFRRYAITSFRSSNDACFTSPASADTAEAIALFDSSMEELADWIYPDEWPDWDRDAAALRDLVTDERTTGVVSIVFDPALEDNSEACAVFQYYVIRDDGTILDVEYNFTD